MAEARNAVKEPRVQPLQSGEEYREDIFREWRRSIIRRFFRTRFGIIWHLLSIIN